MGAGAGSIIDEFWVALGIKPDPEGFKQIHRQVDEAKESLLSVGGAMKAFVAGMAVKEIASIGSTFEQNRIQIAGFLSALGQSSDFNAGLHDAEGVIAQITKDAALLPGEAQEYIEVFKAGFPFVKAAMPGGSLKDMTDFTNQLTAIGKTFGLDAGLIAREFDHMLSAGKGQASLRLPLFRQLMAFMRNVPGQAKLTAESFNAMTAPARLHLLQSTFKQLQPMLDASASSFDAMYGAAVSMVKQLTRVTTAGLFDQIKRGLDQINHLFFNDDATLTDFGKNFVEGAKTIIRWISQIISMLGGMAMWLVKSEVGSKLLKVALVGLGLALAALALEGTISSFGKLFSVLFNIKRLLTGALFVAIALIAEDLYVFSQGGDSVTGMLVKKFGPGLMKVVGIVGVLGLLFLRFPVLMNRVGFSIGMMIGRVMLALGPLLGTIIRIGVVSLVTGARMAASWAMALGPLLLIAAAAFAIGYGLGIAIDKALRLAGILKGPQEPESLKKFNAPSSFKRPGEDDGNTNFLQPLAHHPIGKGAAGAGSSSTDRSTHQTTSVGHITVVSPNPHEAGKAVQRSLARNSQTGVSH
jgi:hypothetical protein